GVLFNTYIICEKENEMFLIDQHAAHEREKYDKIMEQLTSNTLSVQTLLVPYIFNVNSQEQDFFEENFSVFKSIGFEIETFGNNSLKVNTVPYILFSINLKNYFDYILKDIKTLLKKPFEFIKETFTQMACKAATKGGDNLSEKEIVALLKTLDNKGKILLCPHGRPIIIKINKKEIEKWFKRIV
ncbi:MAG: DNA mismatch repair protein MutL, partial [Clostridia bacterium]